MLEKLELVDQAFGAIQDVASQAGGLREGEEGGLREILSFLPEDDLQAIIQNSAVLLKSYRAAVRTHNSESDAMHLKKIANSLKDWEEGQEKWNALNPEEQLALARELTDYQTTAESAVVNFLRWKWFDEPRTIQTFVEYTVGAQLKPDDWANRFKNAESLLRAADFWPIYADLWNELGAGMTFEQLGEIYFRLKINAETALKKENLIRMYFLFKEAKEAKADKDLAMMGELAFLGVAADLAHKVGGVDLSTQSADIKFLQGANGFKLPAFDPAMMRGLDPAQMAPVILDVRPMSRHEVGLKLGVTIPDEKSPKIVDEHERAKEPEDAVTL